MTTGDRPVRRVSLFTRDGRFATYVHVCGMPRVILFEEKTYVAFDAHGLTQSFRECEAETGVK